MQKFIESIQKTLFHENWYGALSLALTMPDICGKLSGTEGDRYTVWFDNYLGDGYRGYLSGKDCYALRCSLLHEGSAELWKQRKREVLDHIIFVSKGSHKLRMSECYTGSQYDGKELLFLSVFDFCNDIIIGVENWMIDIDGDIHVIERMRTSLQIHENGFSIPGLVHIAS